MFTVQEPGVAGNVNVPLTVPGTHVPAPVPVITANCEGRADRVKVSGVLDVLLRVTTLPINAVVTLGSEPVPLRLTVKGEFVTAATTFPLVAVMVMVAPVTGPVAIGVNTTLIVQLPPGAVVTIEQSVAAGGTDGTTVNSADEKVIPARTDVVGAVVGIISIVAVAVEGLFTVTCSVVGTLTATCPKSHVDGVAVCPKAATATKRRTPMICAGILNIDFLK
jgi:hypothetical protein